MHIFRSGQSRFVGFILTLFLVLAESFPTLQDRNNSQRVSHSGIWEVQDVHPSRHRYRRRWSQVRTRRDLPDPKEGTKPFVLDLRNFPGLMQADTWPHNPNIQVSIEVVDSPHTEVEMDLSKEGRSDWPSLSWLGNLLWPLLWELPDKGGQQRSPEYMPRVNLQEPVEKETVLSEEDLEWDSQRNQGWGSADVYDYEENEEWSVWSPCTVTCGHGNQKRIRSCGFACVATESRSCGLDHCPDDLDPVTVVTPSELTSTTEPLPADVDSCEKWLSCKNLFLQKYLQQALTELPSCPCMYPSEAVYGAVTLFDKQLQRAFRWRDASGPKELLGVYRASAHLCIRSMLSRDSPTLAAQQCCYDQALQLLTRGSGAGTPQLVSTDFSPELHHKVDVLPWILCKGDWSRFHTVRPPNNGLRCTDNPTEEEFTRQLREAREY